VNRTKEKLTLHDKIIEIAASANANNFEVRTNPNGEKNWFIRDGAEQYYPDLVLLPNGATQSTIIIEVETDESVEEDHAEEQWVPYSRLGRKFYLLVPSTCTARAKAICRRLGIAAYFGQYWWDNSRWAVRFED